MDSKHMWLWLTSLPGISSAKITRLLERFDTVFDIYSASAGDFAGIDGISKIDIAQLSDKSMQRTEQILAAVNAMGACILYYDDAGFPSALRYCYEPPYVLYVLGERLLWDRLFCISVVGTRKFTEYGAKITYSIAYDLARHGITIVSGMARGLDGIAHNAALKAGGKTVAFLGSGINVVYPPEHGDLMRAIAQNGAVITEFMPGTEAYGKNFPYRNRLIAAFSQGVLVTEAPKKSGTLSTANWALNSGKDVFAVAGDYDRIMSLGCNELIKSGAAKLTDSAMDILAEYAPQLEKLGIEWKDVSLPKRRIINQTPVNTVKQASISDPQYQELGEDEKAILSILISKNAHIDEICRESGMEIGNVSAILTLLELSGFINQLAGKNFSILI